MSHAAETSPKIYILAGPNGAGKTTFADEFLPELAGCKEFLNADLIAAGLSPYAPESAAIRASQILLERIDQLILERQSFSFETTLSGKSYRQAIPRWQKLGFTVHLFFLWLPSMELAVDRIAMRVRHGGHSIPEDVIRRRYLRGISNLFRIYLPCVSEAKVYDGSQLTPAKIWERSNSVETVIDAEKWAVVLDMQEEKP